MGKRTASCPRAQRSTRRIHMAKKETETATSSSMRIGVRVRMRMARARRLMLMTSKFLLLLEDPLLALHGYLLGLLLFSLTLYPYLGSVWSTRRTSSTVGTDAGSGAIPGGDEKKACLLSQSRGSGSWSFVKTETTPIHPSPREPRQHVSFPSASALQNPARSAFRFCWLGFVVGTPRCSK